MDRLEADPNYHDVKIAGWWVWESCTSLGGNSMSNRKHDRPNIGDAGVGVHRPTVSVPEWFGSLSVRLRRVRVCCGDWTRMCGDIVLGLNRPSFQPCAIFLDPPYSTEADRDMMCYRVDSGTIAHAVREWAIERGDDPKLRIALCGYESEHAMPDGWEEVAWKTQGGYGNRGNGRGRKNKHRERIWFSPHCLKPGFEQAELC